MARSTFISKAQKQARGKKLDKSCFTIMFTLNLSGSNKMKPVICHTAKHPRCFNNMKSMSDHPNVYWYQSHKGWMTTTILRDWLLNHFVPDDATGDPRVIAGMDEQRQHRNGASTAPQSD